MSENLYLVCLTIVTACVTFLLRAFPFLAFLLIRFRPR